MVDAVHVCGFPCPGNSGFVIGVQTSPDGGKTPGLPALPLLILLALFYLAVLVPSIAVAVRRLHDAGYSGGWYCSGSSRRSAD